MLDVVDPALVSVPPLSRERVHSTVPVRARLHLRPALAIQIPACWERRAVLRLGEYSVDVYIQLDAGVRLPHRRAELVELHRETADDVGHSRRGHRVRLRGAGVALQSSEQVNPTRRRGCSRSRSSTPVRNSTYHAQRCDDDPELHKTPRFIEFRVFSHASINIT